MYKIVFSPAAVDDLLQTKIYITEELGSKQAAVNTITKITGNIRRLADFPFSGPSLSLSSILKQAIVFPYAGTIPHFTE